MRKLLTILLTVMMVSNTFTANVFATNDVEIPNNEDEAILENVDEENINPVLPNEENLDGINEIPQEETLENAIVEEPLETINEVNDLEEKVKEKNDDSIAQIDLGDQLIGGYTNKYIIETLGLNGYDIGSGRKKYRIRIDDSVNVESKSNNTLLFTPFRLNNCSFI